MTDDTKLLMRYKSMGWNDQQIAEKMSKSEAWVKSMWEAALQNGVTKAESGYNELVQTFNLMCMQLALMSESVKSLGLVFSDLVTQNELSKTIESCPADVSLEQHILSSFIVLKRFTPEDPLKQLERHIASN